MKIRDIDLVVHFTPDVVRFSSKNKPSHIIGLKVDGRDMHYFSNRTLSLSENCLYFLNQKEDYDVEVIERGLAFSIHFTTYEEIDTPSFIVRMPNSTKAFSLLNKIEQLYFEKDNQLDTLSAFYNFCSYINEQRVQPYAKTDHRLLEAKNYIDVNSKNKDCIAEASKLCGLSRRRFNDLFKKNFSLTPNNYLILSKIEYAKKLLSLDCISVEFVAEQSGFNDVYYFIKVFKSKVGMTPSQYRDSKGK